MRNIRRLFSTLSAVAVMSAVLSAPAAWAVDFDEKTFPAAACVRRTGGIPTIDNPGRLFNSSTSSAMGVTCPITRDNTGARWIKIDVVAIDQSTTGGVCCRGISLSPDGNTNFTTTAKCTVGKSSSGQTLTLQDATKAFQDGYFIINCEIPPLSGVASYRILEFE